MDSDPGSKPLQFFTSIPSVPVGASATRPGVTCAGCQEIVFDQYFDVNGQSVCASCRDHVVRQAQTPRSWGVFARACLFGFVAAVAGATLYYAVIAITNFEIGIVAIAIGYMVGYGIRMATDGRGGRRFQVLALVLTYWAVGLAYTPLVFNQMSSPDTAAFVFLGGLSFVLPVLTVVSSIPGGLISAAIIAFGMHQAWRMTAVPQLQISGPYRIGAGPSAGPETACST